MTLMITQTQTCDRCERPFKENYLQQGGNVPAVKRAGCAFVYTYTDPKHPEEEPKTEVVLEFDDLCEGCQKAVASLVEKLKLNSGGKKSSKKKAKATGGDGAKKVKAAKPKAAVAKTKPKNGKKAEEPETAEYEEPEADEEVEEDTASGEDLHEEEFGEEARNLVEDPETGDILDVDTGEVVQTKAEREAAKSGTKATPAKGKGKGKSQSAAKSDAHPF